MELFAHNEKVEQLQTQLSAAQDTDRLPLLMELAWQLRQRDCRQAEAFADEAQNLLAQAPLSPEQRRAQQARLTLVRAEVRLMFADLPAATSLAKEALQELQAVQDDVGVGDALWLEASLGVDRGDGDYTDACLAQAEMLYARAGDQARVRAAQSRRLVYAAFRDPIATGKVLQESFADTSNYAHCEAYWIATAHANVAGLTNDPGKSIKHDLDAYQLALDSGQIRQALVSVSNAVESFALLGDLDAALEWCDPALALARQTGWPATVGLCLLQMGDVLRMLGRFSEARAQLQEALGAMVAVAGSRNYEQVLGNLGQLALDVGDFEDGLKWFKQFEERIQAHQDPDLLIKAWRGQASTLFSLGRVEEAHALALKALELAQEQGNADGQIQILVVLAQLHFASQLPSPPEVNAPNATLHYLLHALEIARGIAGYGVSPDLYSQLALAYAACGDFEHAYAHSQAANEARNRNRNEEAQRRALSMQVRQEMERARAETEHHRQLAITLRETASTLETLGIIGREITASLNAQAVFQALHRHVHDLLDATFFAVYLIDEEHKWLNGAFVVEQNLPVSSQPIAVTNPTSNFAKCARTRKEVLMNVTESNRVHNVLPGTMTTQSLLYAPLVVGERLLGVMSIQSPRAYAYGEREQSIFRALCAYGAIALDNAAAYAAAEHAQKRADEALTELRATQSKLLEQNLQLERLAVTDQLTGLFNRLRLDRTLEEEHSRNMRYGTQFCILLVDVDHFKSVNDTFGHQQGDQILVGIAQALKEGVREVDVVGRWGGEEFLIICRETGIEGAVVLAEKLRAAVYARDFEGVGRRTASFGVAAFRAGEVLTETIARADAALYRAKQNGRNRVENGEVVT